MIVYHGSNVKVNKLKIDNKLSKESSLGNEGPGIYFSKDPGVARSYGKYLYTLNIDGNLVWDLRMLPFISKVMADIRYEVMKKTQVDISKYIDLNSIGQGIYWGNVGVSTLSREIGLHLDSSELLWTSIPNADKFIEEVKKVVTKFIKLKIKIYMFNYSIPEIGVIKDEDLVHIVSIDTVN